MSLEESIQQCEMSDYECEGGYLKNNIGYLRLKEIAQSSNELLKRLRAQAEFCDIKLTELPPDFWGTLNNIIGA